MYNKLVFITLCCLASQTLAATVSSTIYGWGQNDYGQLGLGDLAVRSSPVTLSFFTGLNVSVIKLSQGSTFLTTSSGKVYVQGNNFDGQLGIGTASSTPSTTPVLNTALNSTLDIFPGASAVNARILPSGRNPNTLLGWGLSAANVLDVTPGGKYPKVQQILYAYGFNGKVVGVSAAFGATYVLLNNGTLWSAGQSYTGVLGTGSLTQNSPAFQEITYFRTNNIAIGSLISGQSNHTCAMAVNGSLYCWGQNDVGQLGVNNTNDQILPARVTFFDDNQFILAEVALGGTHTAALTCSGSVFVWGSNAYGQLGGGTADSLPHSTPTQVFGFAGANIVDIEVGSSQVYARTDNNYWFAWGGGLNGALGFGSLSNVYQPSQNTRFTGYTRIFSTSTSATIFAWTGVPAVSSLAGCPTLVNECQLGTDLCANSATCMDTERAYMCICPSGWTGNGIAIANNGTGCNDPDVCKANTTLCIASATCVSTGGTGFVCQCPSGYQGDGTKNGTGCSDIDECAVGGYCSPVASCHNTIGNFTCTCPSGYMGDGRLDDTSCNVICPAGAYPNSSITCAPCPLGTYNSQSHQLTCTQCPNGTFGSMEGGTDQSVCLPCPDGMYSVQGAGFCYPCPAGQTTDSEAITGLRSTPQFCKDCPEGTYGYYGACIACPGGQYSNGTGNAICSECPPGTMSGVGATSCTVCGGGTYSRGNSSTCVPCPVGQYSTAQGASGCSRCEPGSSTNGNTGQGTCAQCLNGQYQPNLGSGQCYNCPMGYFSTSPGSTACQSCPAGSIGISTGAQTCKPCPLNTYSTAVASTSCVPCAAGTVSAQSSGSSQCVPCQYGYYRSSSMTSCQPCPAGQYQNVIGSNSCYQCAGGTYTNSTGNTYCRKCPINTYSNANVGFNWCAPCPAGQGNSGAAASCSYTF